MAAISRSRGWVVQLAVLALIALGSAFVLEIADPQSAQAQSSVRPPAGASISPVEGNVPGRARGTSSQSDIWRAVRKGIRGTVSIPDKQAGQLVQSEGDNWRALKNGPIANRGAIALGAIVILLGLFYLIRGKIMVEHGLSGKTITRFASIERTGHWLLAVSFVILAVTGLNITYGKYFLLPIMGKEAFAGLVGLGKWLHNYVAFAFMAGLVMILVMWIKDNFPNVYDLKWFAQGGGMLTKGSHPPAKKFNGGQKILFWLVIWGGLAMSLTGIALLFPFQINFIASMNPLQEMQFATTWHAIIALGLTVVIIAHIYIGTLGMQGAFDAMGTGEVDENWAREHHSVWADEVIGPSATTKRSKKRGRKTAAAPAE